MLGRGAENVKKSRRILFILPKALKKVLMHDIIIILNSYFEEILHEKRT